MKQKQALAIVGTSIIFATLVCAGAAPAPQQKAATPQQKAATAQEKMASVDYLVGTWNCGHTVGTFSGKYTTTYTKVLGGVWLKQTYDFPAQQTTERNEPAIAAETLMGYDERRQAWVRFFANSLGQYFSIRMTETDNGWSWKYVSFFKRTTPETPDPDATFTKKSDSEYVIDGPSYEQNGTRVTEHHSCHKL
jgi:hypothetical protein